MTLAFKARAQDPTIASYRYRVLEPIAFLKARGQQVEEFDPAYLDRYRTVVFSKAYGPEDRKLARRLKAAGKRVMLDLCDDHFFNPADLPKYREAREGLLAMIALCDRVVCSTPVLARSVQAHAKLEATPAVAPDAYEQAGVSAGPPTPLDQPARLLWFGRHGSPNAPAGMADLLLIKDALAEAQARRPFELVVCSDSAARFAEVSAGLPVPARFVAWTPESFADELARADAVLIPLSDNPFVAAKTHNRLTLALSAGVPVVADRLDSYDEFSPFCWIGDWRAGLEAVLERPDEARARAAEARPYLEAHWSPEAIAPLWEAALDLPARPREPGRVATPQLRPVTPAWAWASCARPATSPMSSTPRSWRPTARRCWTTPPSCSSPSDCTARAGPPAAAWPAGAPTFPPWPGSGTRDGWSASTSGPRPRMAWTATSPPRRSPGPSWPRPACARSRCWASPHPSPASRASRPWRRSASDGREVPRRRPWRRRRARGSRSPGC